MKRKRMLGLLLAVIMAITMMPPYTGANAATGEEQDITDEFMTEFIGELLSRIGRAYKTGGGHLVSDASGRYYDCSGLVASALRDMGVSCPGTAQKASYTWNNWGRTIDWYNLMVSYKDGATITWNVGTDKIKFTVKKDFEGTNQDAMRRYASIPGTLLLKVEEGKTNGHMAVSLGSFEEQSSSAATKNYVRQALIARYGKAVANSKGITSTYAKASTLTTLLQSGTRYNVYAHENVWDYRERTDLNSMGNGVYNPIWQVDSLNDTTGVTVNNNPFGKTGAHIEVALIPQYEPPKGQADWTITKTDADTANVLSGATFALYEWSESAGAYVTSTQAQIREQGGNAGTYKTYGTGMYSGSPRHVYFTSDNLGKIKIVETAAPPGYSNIDPDTGKPYEWNYTFSTGDDVTYSETIDAENEKISGTLSFNKVDENGKSLANIKFGVYDDAECTTLIQTVTTDANGAGQSEKIAIGTAESRTVYVKEIWDNANAAYVKNDTVYTVVIKPDTNTAIGENIVNTFRRGRLHLYKIDSITKDALADIEFTVYADEALTKALTVIVTDENGYAESPAIQIGTGETRTVYVKETKTDGTHALDDTVYTVVLTEDGNTPVTDEPITNDPETTEVSGQKTWSVTDEDNLPPSITVQLYQNGTVYKTKTVTKADGWKYTWTGLPKYHDGGAAYTYTVKEVPMDGWVITYDGYNIVNTSTKVEISKTSLVDGKELAGATLQIIDADGTVVKEWITTGQKTMIEAELIAGATYTLKEIAAPDGSVIATSVTFTVNTDGTVTKVSMADDYTKIVINKVVK